MYDDIVLQVPRSREKVVLNKDDYGDFIRFAVKDADNSVKDLTGWAGRVLALSSESGVTYMVSGSVTLISGAEGTCKYTVTGTDTDTGGRFPARLILTSGAVVTTVSGWEIHVYPYAATPALTEYCTVNDVLADKNIYTLLRLQDYSPEDIREKIQKWSAYIDKKFANAGVTASSSDENIVQLCKLYVYTDVAQGLPTAEASGEVRTSYLGITAQWRAHINDILAQYAIDVPAPVFTEP